MNDPSKNILVTGGCGFIGSELVSQLTRAGHRVIILDNLVNGRLKNLRDLPKDSYTFVKGDVRDADVVGHLTAQVTVVFHLACLGVRHSLYAPAENNDVNATGTLRMLEAARDAGVEKFIYVSTSEVYGNTIVSPLSEINPPNPTTMYGISKLAGESYTKNFHESFGLPTVIVRPFNAFGPRCHHEGDCGEVIPKFLLRLMAGREVVVFGDGLQTRDFTFVQDTAHGIILASQQKDAVGQTINIGSGKDVAIVDLARCIAQILNGSNPKIIHDEPRPGDIRRLCADTTLALKLLNFQPRITLQEGIERLKDWYLTSGKSPEMLLRDEVLHNWKAAATEVIT